MSKLKRILSCFALTFLCFACGANIEKQDSTLTLDETVHFCDCNELIYDPGYNTFYLEDRKKGFTGKCEILYPNGKPQITKNWKNGKLDGEFTTFYENGNVNKSYVFEKNLQVGDAYRYTETGELLFHGKYERGKEKEVVFERLN